MKRLVASMIIVLAVGSCQQSDAVSEFTGNEATYDLQAGSQYAVTGTIVFKERRNGQVTAAVQLQGTDGDAKHPVHLHLGDISSPGADVALMLNPVLGKTGRSETTFSTLGDGSPISYTQLSNLAACIKIHLGDVGAQRDVILAAGDIGLSFKKANPGSRKSGVAVCKSE